IGDDTHPADNQWVGIHNLRQQYTPLSGSPELMYCRNTSTYWPNYHLYAPYIPTSSSTTPPIIGCPQQVIILSTSKAQKTITQDIQQISTETGIWVKKGMNKIVKNNSQLRSDSLLSIFVDSLYYEPTGLLDSVLVLREASMLNEAAIINAGLIPDDITDELDKEVNQYYIAIENSGICTLTSNDIARIREIAALCPFTEGEAVYKARILAAAFDPFGTVYENVCEIESNDKSSSKTQDNKTGFVKAVPNPSSGTFSLFSATLSGKARLIIYDVSGRIVWTGDIEMNTELQHLNLQSGIYHYSLSLQDEIFIGNITILKE
ncbi:MAG: T9SS type A sorting domain-containing protein, partial [Bacteroidota bacterium]|nr:T9SS type A sorting domain-containing protein [Bacteroidota bacterium]